MSQPAKVCCCMPIRNLRTRWQTGFCLNRPRSSAMLPCTTFTRTIPTFIDIPREQALLREHEVIVFQHPLYTYSCPALLKEWLDRVLSRGFASGPGKPTGGKVLA